MTTLIPTQGPPMVDRSILIRTLEILDKLAGISLAEHVLIDEVAIKSIHPCTTDEVRDCLRHAADRGWVERTVGLVNEPRWSRTLAGTAALKDLKHP